MTDINAVFNDLKNASSPRVQQWIWQGLATEAKYYTRQMESRVFEYFDSENNELTRRLICDVIAAFKWGDLSHDTEQRWVNMLIDRLKGRHWDDDTPNDALRLLKSRHLSYEQWWRVLKYVRVENGQLASAPGCAYWLLMEQSVNQRYFIVFTARNHGDPQIRLVSSILAKEDWYIKESKRDESNIYQPD